MFIYKQKQKYAMFILRLRLVLQTRVRYTVFVAYQSYQSGITAMGLKLRLYHH